MLHLDCPLARSHSQNLLSSACIADHLLQTPCCLVVDELRDEDRYVKTRPACDWLEPRDMFRSPVDLTVVVAGAGPWMSRLALVMKGLFGLVRQNSRKDLVEIYYLAAEAGAFSTCC